MSFWIRVTVNPNGLVSATTYSESTGGKPLNQLKTSCGTSVSQALRAMAADMAKGGKTYEANRNPA